MELDDGDHVAVFQEKSGERACGQLRSNAIINGSVYVLSRECLARIPTGCEISLEKGVLLDLIAGRRIVGSVTDGYFPRYRGRE